MHYHILDLLKEGGVRLNDPQYSKEGFLPHSTVQKHAQVKSDDAVNLDNLALIDMFPNGDAYQRKVLKVEKLKPKAFG